jgi:hypothetical protein
MLCFGQVWQIFGKQGEKNGKRFGEPFSQLNIEALADFNRPKMNI